MITALHCLISTEGHLDSGHQSNQASMDFPVLVIHSYIHTVHINQRWKKKCPTSPRPQLASPKKRNGTKPGRIIPTSGKNKLFALPRKTTSTSPRVFRPLKRGKRPSSTPTTKIRVCRKRREGTKQRGLRGNPRRTCSHFILFVAR